MTDVSCRAWAYFRACERAGLIEIDTLLEGLSVPAEFLDDPSNRVPWEFWVEVCTRFGRAFENDQAVIDSADAILDVALSGPLQDASVWFSSPRAVYRATTEWMGPLTYRNFEFSLEEIPDGRLLLEISGRPDDPVSRTWMLMAQGAMERIPRLMGQPRATVEARAIDHRLIFDISLPEISEVDESAGRDASLLAELEFQHRQLKESYSRIQRTENEFTATLQALPAAVFMHSENVIRYQNDFSILMLGRQLGQAVDGLIHPEDTRSLAAVLDGAASVPLRIRKTQKGWHHVVASGAPT